LYPLLGTRSQNLGIRAFAIIETESLTNSSQSTIVASAFEIIPKSHDPISRDSKCGRGDIAMNGQKNRVAALGLVFVVGAVLGLLAGNKEIREQLGERS
jgi:hypothetical protein